MKNKLYTLLTSLLMATYITSYGQEIVNEFTIQRTDKDFWECDLFENEDGTLLFKTLMYTPNESDYEYLLYKITPEGEVLDSLIFDGLGDYSKLLRNPMDPHSYILTDDIRYYNDVDSTVSAAFRMFFIDENLNLNDEISVPIYQFPIGYYEYFPWDLWFIDTQNDFIISFWTDNIFHMMRIGLDGTIKASTETNALFEPNYSQPLGDTTLHYSEMGFGIFSESPLTYYKLGGFSPTSGPWPIYGYFFDADLNLIDTQLYDQFNENIAFDGGNNEHIVPLKDGTYLTATQIKSLSPALGGVGLAKYDMNHNPICISPHFGTNHCYPHQTVIANDNTIYQLYNIGGGYSTFKWALARLNGDLDLDWDMTLPESQIYAFFGTSMIILKNGAIAACSICKKNMRYGVTIVILNDDYDNTLEMKDIGCPFILFPNPVKDELNLRFDEGTEPVSVELFDLAGRLVGTKSNGQESIDMSKMPSGMYLLRVTMKDGSRYHEKILKE
jgi:hypothetical protein